jgi:hypothetical protein
VQADGGRTAQSPGFGRKIDLERTLPRHPPPPDKSRFKRRPPEAGVSAAGFIGVVQKLQFPNNNRLKTERKTCSIASRVIEQVHCLKMAKNVGFFEESSVF